MYELMEKLINKIKKEANVNNPLWDIERIKCNKPIRWNYIDGCIMNSFLEGYLLTNDTWYMDFIDNYIDYFIDEDGNILNYDLNKFVLDDICEGRVLFELYDYTKKEKYQKAIKLLYEQITKQPRTKEGNFWHKAIYPNQVWLDGLYMAMPFYVKYCNYYHIDKYQDILNQYKNVRKYMFDENKGLYYHGFDSSKEIFWADKKTGLSKSFWLRAMGWYFVSLVDVYELLPKNVDKSLLEHLINEFVEKIFDYQDEKTKLFYQVVDQKNKTGNYLETSGSSMFAYAIMKASRLGVIDKSYFKLGKEIFEGIYNNYLFDTSECVELGNICLVSGLGPSTNLLRDGSFEYYISEPIVKNDGKGVAPLIMAYNELLRGNL